jgi:antitoxin component of RelBE/YafQ-DinJ toxin-antitoxin module
MTRTILQVPIQKTIKDEATQAAYNMGFSSLQEAIRIMLFKLAKGEMTISVKEEKTVQLSPKAIKRYNKLFEDIESGKEKVYSHNSVDEFLKHLHSLES